MKLRLRQPLALLLTIAMLLGLLPTVAFATEGSTETKNPYAHANHDNANYEEWTTTNALPTEAGTYYLSDDITLAANWDVPEETILCLNGHNINLNTYRLEVGKDEHLVICDCSTVVHAGYLDSENYDLWTPGEGEGETCNLTGGVIYGGVSSQGLIGSCIHADGGDVTLAGGNIAGNLHVNESNLNESNMNGAVYISNGDFTMYDGSITGNYSRSNGGGIYITSDSRSDKAKISLYGGEIRYNIAEYFAGGVYVGNNCDFLLDGAAIEYNTAGFTRDDAFAGGVYITGNYNTATISSGSICYNTCNGSGGGLYLSGSGYTDREFFKMTGGLIKGNSSCSRYTYGGDGAGIAVTGGKVEITGGAILENSAKGAGGGIRAINSNLTIRTAVTIGGNTSQTGGSDIYFKTSEYRGNSLTLAKPQNDGDAERYWFDDTPDLRYEGNESRVTKYAGNINSDESKYLIVATGIPTYPVTVESSYAETTGAGQYAAGATVTIQAGTREDYTFDGWTVTPESVKLTNADSATTTFTMPAGNVTVTANWASNEKIQVTPADIIIYMGGKSYEGVVDGSGTIIAI